MFVCSSSATGLDKEANNVESTDKGFNGGIYAAVGCIEHGEFAFEISTGFKHGKTGFLIVKQRFKHNE